MADWRRPRSGVDRLDDSGFDEGRVNRTGPTERKRGTRLNPARVRKSPRYEATPEEFMFRTSRSPSRGT